MKRILFVDDETHVLDGMKRMLRSHRSTWDMVFAASADEALAAMDAEPFDVLVTDMKMPGMDGAALLAEVKARHPRTVRLVLSGHTDLEVSLRAVSVSHQFLAKPCDPAVLTEVVERACRLDELLRDPTLQRMLGEVGELPVVPRTYRALTAAMAESEVDLSRIAAIVEQDPGLTAKVLQLVNSSYFGVRREITNVRQATSHLGLNTIRDLVLTLEVFQPAEHGTSDPRFSLEGQQAHALLTGRIARKLVPDRKVAEQAFLAALLHDIGKTVLATRKPDLTARLLDAGAGRTVSWAEAELAVLGVTHAEIGGYLLGAWGMPYLVVEAVANHHRPQRVEHSQFGLVDAVHIADALANEAAGTADPAEETLDLELLEHLGVLDELPEWRRIAVQEAGGEEATDGSHPPRS